MQYLSCYPSSIRAPLSLCLCLFLVLTLGHLSLQAQSSAIDVLQYDIWLDWRGPLSAPTVSFETRSFPAVNTITAVIQASQSDTISLYATSMEIDSLIINGIPLIPPPQPQQERLRIPLPTSASKGDTVQIRIAYRHISQFYRGHFDPNNRGFYLYPKGYRVGADHLPSRLAFTLGAPADARYWLPCNDIPGDKALVRYHVAVPKGFVTACNGTLDSVTVLPNDSAHIDHWHHRYPIAPYLMVVHASRYTRYDTLYRRIPLNDTIPIQYYVWAKDWDTPNWKYNARSAFAPVPAILRCFEQRLGPYPFEQCGMATAQPFLYFAMEHQTMITFDRRVLSGNHSLTIAHELFHQWMGNKVTPASWNDIWINEGAATYGEALWAECASGYAAYQQVMAEKRDAYLANNRDGTQQPPCYREIREPIDLNDIYNYAITYAKGGWIYHMLRFLAGDSAFFAAWRALCDSFAYQNISTQQMQTFFARHLHTPIPIDTFFNQWIFRQGHPIYAIAARLSYDPTAQETTVFVEIQQQQTSQPAFWMPLEFAARRPDGSWERFTILDTQRLQYATVVLPFYADSLIFDPDRKILAVAYLHQQLTAISPHTRAAKVHLQVVPFPNRALLQITAPAPLHRVILWSAIGTKVLEMALPIPTDTLHFTLPLPAGLYFLEAISTANRRYYATLCLP